MPIDYEPQPAAYHVVLHFKQTPFYFSTYVLALIEKYAIEVAQVKLRDHAKILEAEHVEPYYATVSSEGAERYFVRRAGEWLELEVWQELRAKKISAAAIHSQDRETSQEVPNSR